MKILTIEEEAERLKAKFEGVNRAEFARVHEIKGGQSMIYQNITGRRPISMEAAMAYARGFGCTLAEISPRLAKEAQAAASHLALVPSGRSEVPGAMRVVIDDPDDANFYHIKKVKLQLRAGVTGFQTIPDIYDGDTISLRKNWVDRGGMHPNNLLALTVAGESMEPNLYEGDIVVVDTAEKTMKDGAVYAFNYDGESVIKRLVKERGEWWLFSDNPDQAKHRPKGCRDGDCGIIGRVVRRETDHI